MSFANRYLFQISATHFGMNIHEEWDLSTHIGDKPGILHDIAKLKLLPGGTGLYGALADALDVEINNRDPGRRPDTPLVIVVFTDGRTKVCCHVRFR